MRLADLIIGSSRLVAKITDGVIIHLLATPVRRSSVVLTKFAVATGLTVLFAAIPELIAALIAGGGSASSPAGEAAGLVSISTSKLAIGLVPRAPACSGSCNAVVAR